MEPLQPQLQKNIWETNPNLKTLLLILIGVFLLSGIGLVIFSQWSSAYREKIYEQTQAGLPKHEIKSATTTMESQTDVSTWKTYQNDEYGFEFQYPDGITVGEGVQNGVFSADYCYSSGSGCLIIFAVYIDKDITSGKNNYDCPHHAVKTQKSGNYYYHLLYDPTSTDSIKSLNSFHF